MLHCLENIASFMEALPMDSPSNLWTTICNQFQTFLTKLPSVLPLKVGYRPFRSFGHGLIWSKCDYGLRGDASGGALVRFNWRDLKS